MGASSSGSARIRVRAAWLAVIGGALLLAAKLFGAWYTGSAAILSDALESIVNVVTAVVALFSVSLAVQPADEDHPFGHGKVEALTSGVEGALLLGAGGAILWAAVPGFFDPPELLHLDIGLAIVAGTAAANLGLGLHLIRTGRKVRSPALVADGKHLLADVVTSAGLLVGLGAARVTGLTWLDSLTATAAALWVLLAGARVLRASIGLLMDERSAEHVGHVLAALGTSPPEGLLDPHDLRVIDASTEQFLSLHAFAPRYWDLTRTQALRDEVRRRLAGAAPVPVTVVLQIEPCHDDLCPECTMADCPVRAAPALGNGTIDPARLRRPEPARDH